jgi:co-chaperonin GroES (HSP10)
MRELKPTGYYVLIRMEEVEQVSEGGIIMATNAEHKREQNGHDVGVIVAFGPTCFDGYQGINGTTTEERAAQWGCKVGDRVEFNRYDGKVPRDADYQDHRIIQDAHIIGVLGD